MTISRDELALYVMGEHDDPEAIEAALEQEPELRAAAADEARLEMLLQAAAAAATFCAGCGDPVAGARCDGCGAAVAPGGYTVEKLLVSGAHGRMYAARDADGKQVALKELAFLHAPTLDVIAAFEREAKLLRALDHPAIPRFVASFEEGTGVHVRYYLAQELVTGEALDARLAEHWFREDEIVGLARQVLEVLVYLQSLSPVVIHRDIKPANLIARADGTIAVVDFGAAHVQGATAGSTSTGTFGYMPVEQLAGLVDATTDPYALGASLLHLLTRREPWRILQGTGFADINVSPALRAFLEKLVAPDPRDRYPDARAALADLERVEKGQPIMDKMVERPVWRRPLVAAAAALVLAGNGVGGYRLLSSDDEPAAPADPVERELANVAHHRDVMCACPLGDKPCGERAMEALNVERASHRTMPNPGQRKRMLALNAEATKCFRQAILPPAVAKLKLPAGVLGELWIDGELYSPVPISDGHELQIAPGDHAFAVMASGDRSCDVDAKLASGETTFVECTPAPPSKEPRNAPPSFLSQTRGVKHIMPDDATKLEIDATETKRAIGSFKMCIDARGEVTTVKKLKSTGFPPYDDKIEREIRGWAFEPFSPDGRPPAPMCTALTFIYSSKPE